MSDARVSVVVPVKDGERYLPELLDALARERVDEVLVIDSGSRDRSVEIARSADATVLEIEPAEFGHGRTRNLGAERSSGELICFLTQDATPAPGWLAAYRDAFALEPRVGAAFGPHLPRPETSPMIARELTEFFRGFSPGGEPVAQRTPAEAFLSNVNACYARACWEQIRFPELDYAEDQAFGRRMLEAGWIKVFHPAAAVLHAHDYGSWDFMRRYFDEYRGLRAATGHVEPVQPLESVRTVRTLVAADSDWMREQGWSASARAAWIPRAALHHTGRAVFSALGSRAERLPAPLQRGLSLESRAADGEAASPSLQPTGAPVGRPISAQIERAGYAAITEYDKHGAVALEHAVPGMSARERLHIALVIPSFKKGSGGHGTIFRMVRRWERMGHSCSIWIYDPIGHDDNVWPAFARGLIREQFAPIEGPVFKGFDSWYGADVAVATGWQTVYPVLRLDRCRTRAYLIQDHESEFYATSMESYWAERTYRLGLHAIAASSWLRDVVAERYGQSASVFELGVEHEVYRPRPVERRRDTVVFYARDVTPRRAVALGLLALDELRRRKPQLRFVLFGNARPLPTSFPYEHVGVVTPEQLSWLYSEATAGLCLSLTNYSLIPQEMMACGLPCVDLAGFANESAYGPDGPVELAEPSVGALADAIERLLDDEALWRARADAGLAFVAERDWDRAAAQVEAGFRDALRERERADLPAELQAL